MTIAVYFAEPFAHNFAFAVLFRHQGLLLAVVPVWLTYYLVWHVGYGNFTA